MAAVFALEGSVEVEHNVPAVHRYRSSPPVLMDRASSRALMGKVLWIAGLREDCSLQPCADYMFWRVCPPAYDHNTEPQSIALRVNLAVCLLLLATKPNILVAA